MPKEEWRSITDYEWLYEISSEGRVKSLKSGKVMKLEVTKDDYRRIMLCKDGERERFVVHRLVAQEFVPNVENKPQINHIDTDKSNNKPENLEWSTQSENVFHYRSHGLGADNNGEKNGMSKLSKENVGLIKSLYAGGGFTYKELGVKFGVSKSTVSDVVKNRRWKSVSSVGME